MDAQSVENIFVRSWDLLNKNWIIIVPGLAIGVIAGILAAIFAPTVTVIGGGDWPASYSVTRGGGLPGIIALAAVVINIAYTTGMAGAAWERGVTTVADGSAALREDWVRILLAMLLLGVVAVVLGVITLGIGALVFGFFAIYTMASVVLSKNGAVTGLRESFAIASKRWQPTLLIVGLLIVVGIVGGLVQGLLIFVPLLGPIVAAAINGAVTAFATLVIAGEYLTLRRELGPQPPV